LTEHDATMREEDIAEQFFNAATSLAIMIWRGWVMA